MFKFFDMQDKGSVDFQMFCRVLEKSNMYFPAPELQVLFDSYDQDASGALDYREFTLAVFGKAEQSKAIVAQMPKLSDER